MLDRIQKIKKLKNRLDKVMYFVAVLTDALKKHGIKPVLVGGGALEFYTQGSYMTADIDLVIEGREQAKRVLEEMGFQHALGERYWYNEELELSVEIPGDRLAGSMGHIVAVDVGDGLTGYVIGVEDLIIDRLTAYKYWKSLSDGEWAVAVLSIHLNDVDFDYLKGRAEEEKIIDELEETINKAKNLQKRKRKK